jgi:hypothetical protein
MRLSKERFLLAAATGLALCAGILLTPPEGMAGTAAASAAPAATVEPALWKAVAASGPVEAARNAASGEQPAWSAVRRGDRLEPRTEIRTGRRGRTTLVRRGDVLIVDPDSHVALPDADAAGAPAAFQRSGSVVYEVAGGKGHGFRVITPYLVAGVKGTVFMVTVARTHASVTVEEGIVEIMSRSTGATLDLGPGESVRLDASEGAGMEHVVVRGARESAGARKETLEAARQDARRLASAVAAREEIPLEEPPKLDDPDHDDADLDTLEEELDRVDKLEDPTETPVEEEVDREARKASATTGPTEP